MGNTGIASDPDGFSFYYNPASLPLLERKYLSLNYYFLTLDRFFHSAGFSMPLKPSAGLSICWISAGVKNIEGRTLSGLIDEIYNTSENAFYVSFGNKFFNKILLGINVKILYNDLVEVKGKGMGADLGILFLAGEDFRIGLVAKDLGSSYSYNTQSVFERGSNYIDKFPVIYKAGVYKKFFEKLVFAIDGGYSDKEDFVYHIGTSYLFSKILEIRMGVNNGSFTAGFGTQYKAGERIDLNLGYAIIFGIAGEGETHVLSWQFLF
ncbi:MAG: hypothetical protein H0Z29_07155 [Candidatus Marinimicrobia bacterium]|nr:hypothetical protein [Candidatus Neomarinimicrobiota bacterium]